MKDYSFSIASEAPEQAKAPRRLNKPLRETELPPEQVVTYSDECDVVVAEPPGSLGSGG
ncbi:Hypothetical protein A7982_00783 [Minicystis rosea]|nr:Hypothetical protein A7982_00783 [Minicystis rosea]